MTSNSQEEVPTVTQSRRLVGNNETNFTTYTDYSEFIALIKFGMAFSYDYGEYKFQVKGIDLLEADDTLEVKEDTFTEYDESEKFLLLFEYGLLVLLGVVGIIAMTAKIYAFYTKADNVRTLALIYWVVFTWDFVSDLFFAFVCDPIQESCFFVAYVLVMFCYIWLCLNCTYSDCLRNHTFMKDWFVPSLF